MGAGAGVRWDLDSACYVLRVTYEPRYALCAMLVTRNLLQD